MYLFQNGDENLLLDTCWNDVKAYESLLNAFSEIDFKVENLKTILISHLHPDHIGLASKLKREAKEVAVLMHEKDCEDMAYTPEAYGLFVQNMSSFLKNHGAPEADLREMIATIKPLEDQFSGAAKPSTLLKGGETIRVGRWKLRVIGAPGHTRGNICVSDHSGEILFSGDHILPRITPNVSLSPIYDGDPLGDYLRSIASLKKLQPKTVLPSHEYIFNNLGKRIEEIEGHHRERLSEVLQSLETSAKSGFEVAAQLTWSVGQFVNLSPWQRRAALTETLAHIEYLKRQGKVIESRKEIVRYSKVTS